MPSTQPVRFDFVARAIRRKTQDRLEEFRQYTSEVESKFDADRDALHRRYDAQTAGLTDEEIENVVDYFVDDLYTIEEVYVGSYRRSTLVSLYSFLENTMNLLCRNVAVRDGHTVLLDDLKGEGIVRANSYLKKVVGVNFDPLNGEWSRLITLNKVRNCIVHSEGDVTGSKSSGLSELIAGTNGLSLKNDRLIVVERAYVDFCITTIETFLDKLCQQAL